MSEYNNKLPPLKYEKEYEHIQYVDNKLIELVNSGDLTEDAFRENKYCYKFWLRFFNLSGMEYVDMVLSNPKEYWNPAVYDAAQRIMNEHVESQLLS